MQHLWVDLRGQRVPTRLSNWVVVEEERWVVWPSNSTPTLPWHGWLKPSPPIEWEFSTIRDDMELFVPVPLKGKHTLPQNERSSKASSRTPNQLVARILNVSEKKSICFSHVTSVFLYHARKWRVCSGKSNEEFHSSICCFPSFAGPLRIPSLVLTGCPPETLSIDCIHLYRVEEHGTCTRTWLMYFEKCKALRSFSLLVFWNS